MPGTTYNLENLSPNEFHLITDVLKCLKETIGEIEGRIMLVGAQARDLMHRRLGAADNFLRTTSDVDLALAVANHVDYAELTSHFIPRRSQSDVKFNVAGQPVDLIPFGDIENPEGSAKPRPGSDALSVFAYSSAFEAADTYMFPGEIRLKVVDPLHYAALKLDAWVDRSAFGQYKDASDLRVVFDWFRQHAQYIERAYTGDPSPAERWDWDEPLACLWILGTRVADVIGPGNTRFVLSKWNVQSQDFLASHIGKARDSAGSNASSRDEVRAFADGLAYKSDLVVQESVPEG